MPEDLSIPPNDGDIWSKEEATIACAFYLNPTGRLSDTIDFLTDVLGRSKKSVSAKFYNFASYDQEVLQTGRVGLRNGGRNSKEVWNEFQNNYDVKMDEAYLLLEKRGYDVGELVIDDSFIPDSDIGPGRTRMVETEVRVNQGAFRRLVLKTYGNKCCLTGIKERELLIASHIKPWAVCDALERTDVHNALCLNRLHDGLFDHYMMTIDSDMNVYYADSLEKQMGRDFFEESIAKYDKVRVKKEFRPSPEYIEYHNLMFMKKNNLKTIFI